MLLFLVLLILDEKVIIMKKIILFVALLVGVMSIEAQKRLTFEKYDFCGGAVFNKVSNNGKYVAGYSSASYGGANTGFVYLVEEDSIFCLNPEYAEDPEFSHLVSASAMDVSDDGIVVGRYTFDDAELYESEPGYYNISTGMWTKLELPKEIDGRILYENAVYGEATSISADGRYIGGYVQMRMTNGNDREVACVWVRTNDDPLNPKYELQKPVDKDPTKILSQGDRAYHMSNDGRWLGGHGVNNFGCFNVMIWENHFNDSLLDRTLLVGKEDIDREDTNEDGIIDDTDGGVDGQYWWGGTVNNISPNGEWICGEHSYNGTGYADGELKAVGFRYNTKTKVFEDSLFGGIPFVIFDDGEMIFSTISNGIMSSSDDKSVYCGTYATDAGFGMMSMPMIILNKETAVDNVKDLAVDVYVNGCKLKIVGDYTSVEIYSMVGALVGSYDREEEINVSNLNCGVYLVRVIDGAQSITKKVVF
jgi:hypothetical protein